MTRLTRSIRLHSIRSTFLLLAVGLLALVSSVTIAHQTVAQSSTPKQLYQAEVAAGVNYFKRQAQAQLPLVESLLAALKQGNVAEAQRLYVDARPPYEEIEVYAGSFEQEDSDIDARPYAFDEGESSPEFRGFHRIEALIYRDQNLADAVPYAERLIASVKSLQGKLNDLSNFSASKNFDGMIALATEVPAKKISSEEETWSDQSLVIFKHNWIGIYSQFKPYEPALAKRSPDLVTAVARAYQNCLKTVEPFFTPGRVAAQPYSTLNAQQRQAIVQASYQFRDALVAARQALGIS